MNIFELFEHQLKLNPDAVAVVAEDETASYAQLAEKISNISHLLAQQELIAEQAIGILMHRSVEMIATLLAVLKIGAAYLPLEPDDPVERHQAMLDIAGCRLVLTDKTLRPVLQTGLNASDNDHLVQLVTIDHPEQAPVTNNPPVSCAPGGSRLAYILFTSGSTGEPKGVEIEHRSVVNLLLTVRDLIGFTPADRYLAVATIAFDISVMEIFLPLVCGGSLLLRDRKLLAAPDQLAKDVENHHVSIMQTGASLWASILGQQPEFPRLRVAITTSEAISPASAHKLVAYGEQVWNLYGPTETTVWATGFCLTGSTFQQEKGANISAPIGQAIANAEVYVLDDMLLPVADGEIGELCIGGPGLARGYLNDSHQTEKQFITQRGTGKRLYRTGDLVLYSDDQLNYLGRIDDQLQIHGVRIEPREIESSILLHPCIQQVAATWYDTPDGSRSIVAAIVLKPGEMLSSGDLYDWLATKLPAQMMPSKIIFQEALALTKSGKIDHTAIRKNIVISALDAGDSETSTPSTSTEESLAGIWQSLLAVKSVKPQDHFFTIGGDSLAAVRMILEVEALMQISLSVQMVYESPTLASFAAKIDRIKKDAGKQDESSYVFQLTGEGDDRPVFFNNINLSIATGNNWKLPCPLYCISYWAKGSGFLEVDSLEELAATHIAEIRKIQAQGPYRLAGFSFGGLIAFEIARQLTEFGETVESLFLVEPREPDCIFVADRQIRIIKHESISARIVRHCQAILDQPGEITTYLGHRLMPTIRTNNITRWISYKMMHSNIRKKNQVAKLLVPKNQGTAIRYYIDRLVSDYVAKPYSGPARAVFGDYENFGYMAGTWSKLIGEDAILHIPEATHSSLFSEPALSQWMSSLANELDINFS